MHRRARRPFAFTQISIAVAGVIIKAIRRAVKFISRLLQEPSKGRAVVTRPVVVQARLFVVFSSRVGVGLPEGVL